MEFEMMMPDGCGDVSFGASFGELQTAATIGELAEQCGATPFGNVLSGIADSLSGADMPGMEMIRECVVDTSTFFHIDPVNVFYERGEPGVQWDGATDATYDNWIGGDPEVLANFAQQYGDDFTKNVFAHEMGHHVIDRLGLDDEIPRIANEAASDYLAGVYAGAKGLDAEGFSSFLEAQPDDGVLYPDGSDRCELFLEGFNDAQSYTFSDFQSIVDDPRFDLRGTVEGISGRYC